MKKILSIALGELSTGELSIAIEFGKNLNADNYKNHLLIPEDKERILEKGIFEKVFKTRTQDVPEINREKITKLLQEEEYHIIILFDIFTFEYAQTWTGITSEMLLETGAIIVSLDEYEYTKAGYILDYYGFFNKKLPKLLDKCDFILKNCPLAMSKSVEKSFAQGSKGNEYYYRFMGRAKRLKDEEKKYIRKKYITESESAKVVFFTTSQWEFKGAYSFAAQNRLVTWLGVALFEYLKMLDKEIVLLHVGSGSWNIPLTDPKVKYVHYDSFPVEEFEKVLQSVDLYATFNLVSITLSKAIIFGVPSIVLNNSKVIDFSRLGNKLSEKPKWYQDLAEDVKKIYPFTASMFGLNNFLSTVMKDNVYINTFERTEFFIIKRAMDSLRKMLYQEDYIKALLKNNEKFTDEYYKLPSSQEILLSIEEAMDKKNKGMELDKIYDH